jgi:hypothetical protein
MPTSTQYNAGTRLLLLPPELRNIITNLVLGHCAITPKRHSVIETRAGACDWTPSTVALILVCRQLYVEMALLTYSLNTFVVTSGRDRDYWTAHRNTAQLEAIPTIELQNIHPHDTIDGKGGLYKE